MDLSPPPLSRSPVSSPNTDYPSPDLVGSHYRLTALYEQGCGMDPNLESEPLPPLDTTTSTGWSGTTLLHPTTSADIPNILPADYDTFANYDPSLHVPYGHDIYTTTHAQVSPAVSLNSNPLVRSFSHSPDPSAQHALAYRHSASPQPRIKMEGTSEYPDPVEAARYHSPHIGHGNFMEAGSYSSVASSSGYLSDAASGSWKSDYGALEPEAYAPGHTGPSGLPDRTAYRVHKPSRTRPPRKLTTKEEANYQCEVKGCGKLFSRSYNYKAHLETHDENREYPFPCTVPGCTKKFVRKTDLQRHNGSVHMKVKDYKCDYCSRMFARKDTLRRYMLHPPSIALSYPAR
jgi:hypothetical protein